MFQKFLEIDYNVLCVNNQFKVKSIFFRWIALLCTLGYIYKVPVIGVFGSH